ncbi:RNA-guided endonuclease TnpB family protein [Thioclava sp. F36-7]|uniref:RNA-guided endonuclease InsQ/TnpB family protein n=1 Tax=Thioclava sp. F36-7 TaxID=1915317 RepID=UPI0009987111|nr:RNA-guided endonuclease TnpB family protein [Thioclava sp. F36-7]OOY07932.1 hypothetical protein BMI89_13645 [Thioclava sp. F36-7]
MSSIRSLSFKLYPSRAQSDRLEQKHDLLVDLWNAALEERIGAWRHGVHLRLADQEKALKHIRADVEGWSGCVHSHEAQVVLKRLDRAFQSFFKRVRAGQRSGFPRFRSRQRFRGWGYKQHCNGFKVELGPGGRHGHVTLFGVGRMRMRGVARTPGRILKADVFRSARGWMLNVVVETDCAQREDAHGPAAGLDWGVSDFATLANENGEYEAVANPRHLRGEMEGLVEAQRRLSAAAKARKVSLRSLQRHRKQLARRHAKIAARRKDFLHKVSADLVSRHRLIATEGLDVGNMTRAAKGSKQCPGKNVAQKSGLNRAILDTAPSNFLKMLRYKAEEAGVEFLEAPTRKLKPSQSCPACGAQKRKTLSQRQHICECGCSLGRDEAAACVLLQWGLTEEARLKTLSGERDKAAGTAADQALI